MKAITLSEVAMLREPIQETAHRNNAFDSLKTCQMRNT